MKRLLKRNPLTTEAVYIDFNAATNSTILTHEQDADHVQLILDANKEAANDHDKSTRQIKNDILHYARIPNIVWYQWYVETGQDLYKRENKRELFRRINSREYRDCKMTDRVHNERE